MNFFKENTKHAIHLYVMAVGIMALTIISGLTRNRTNGYILKILCDGFSLCAATFFLASYFYRLKHQSFRAVMGYYFRHLRGKQPADPKTAESDREVAKAITNDLMDSLFLFWISAGMTIILMLVYMIRG